MPLIPWATHVLHWARQKVANSNQDENNNVKMEQTTEDNITEE